MFHTKSQPKLKGKAGEVKDLGPVMVLLWRKHMNEALLIHRKILVVLEGFLFIFRSVVCFESFYMYCSIGLCGS